MKHFPFFSFFFQIQEAAEGKEGEQKSQTKAEKASTCTICSPWYAILEKIENFLVFGDSSFIDGTLFSSVCPCDNFRKSYTAAQPRWIKCHHATTQQTLRGREKTGGGNSMPLSHLWRGKDISVRSHLAIACCTPNHNSAIQLS